MNRDGTGIQKVNQRSFAKQYGGGWKPDGSGLVFEAGDQGNHNLWLVGLDGKARARARDLAPHGDFTGLLARWQMGGVHAGGPQICAGTRSW